MGESDSEMEEGDFPEPVPSPKRRKREVTFESDYVLLERLKSQSTEVQLVFHLITKLDEEQLSEVYRLSKLYQETTPHERKTITSGADELIPKKIKRSIKKVQKATTSTPTPTTSTPTPTTPTTTPPKRLGGVECAKVVRKLVQDNPQIDLYDEKKECDFPPPRTLNTQSGVDFSTGIIRSRAIASAAAALNLPRETVKKFSMHAARAHWIDRQSHTDPNTNMERQLDIGTVGATLNRLFLAVESKAKTDTALVACRVRIVYQHVHTTWCFYNKQALEYRSQIAKCISCTSNTTACVYHTQAS